MFSIVKRGQVYQPTVSGNGKVVAWRDLPERGVSEIGIQRDGEAPTLFTDDRVAVQNPQLNYDGSVVVFERHDDSPWSDWDIARQEKGQSEPEIIFNTDGLDTDVDVSADGNKIVIDHWPKNRPRIRTVNLWSKGEGVKQLSPEGVSSGLPEISGDGNRVFYLHLPPNNRLPNAIWMQEADGSEKPVVYEPGPDPEANQKSAFDTDYHGNVLAWVEKNGVAPASVWKWNLSSGLKEKVDEAPRASQVKVSGDGSTITWITNEKNSDGQEESVLHWRKDGTEKIVSAETVGNNTSPSLSYDGNTLVWMWKNPDTYQDHEIRKMTFN